MWNPTRYRRQLCESCEFSHRLDRLLWQHRTCTAYAACTNVVWILFFYTCNWFDLWLIDLSIWALRRSYKFWYKTLSYVVLIQDQILYVNLSEYWFSVNCIENTLFVCYGTTQLPHEYWGNSKCCFNQYNPMWNLLSVLCPYFEHALEQHKVFQSIHFG